MIAIFSIIKKLIDNRKRRRLVTPRKSESLNGKPVIIPRHQHVVSRTDISDNALKVLRRLNKAGFDAYLVGGSVRDLALRRAPKDFDIATDAKPEQIKQLFRNCRLIGRRFRLAHIHFGREIIEVATFRGLVKESSEHHVVSDEGMILRDNVYGTIEDDAIRRDFTVNALYYTVTDFSIVDYTGGLQDIQQKTLRLIGDPEKRYLEDPVRMLRAIRFMAKLDFKLDPATAAPIEKLKHTLHQVSRARLFEETLKLLQHGRAGKVYQHLVDYDLFDELFPIIKKYRDDENKQAIEQLIIATFRNTDKRIQNHQPVTPAFLFAALLWFPLLKCVDHFKEKGLDPLPALDKAMERVLQDQNKVLAIPKRYTSVIREIWLLQYRLPKRYGKRAYRILEHPRFRAGYDFLVIRAEIKDAPKELADWWTKFQNCDYKGRQRMLYKRKAKKSTNDN